MFHSKFVVRGGSGLYYDRGELFTYLSPGYAAGEVDGGPFGIVQTEPFVNQQHCPYSSSFNAANPTYLYLNYIPICGGDALSQTVDNSEFNLSTPWGTIRQAPPSNPNSRANQQLPAQCRGTLSTAPSGQQRRPALHSWRLQSANKLPYSINFTLNLQYQPRNDLMIEIGYVGNLDRHQVIPLPFNQAQIATPNQPHPPRRIGHAVFQLRLYGA